MPRHMCGSEGTALLDDTMSLISAVWHIPGWRWPRLHFLSHHRTAEVIDVCQRVWI